MSKSVGNVARYQDYVDVFGVDALRYFVMREMPLGQDANFSDEGILTRFNADLANDLGNVVSRTTTMIQRYRESLVPAPGADDGLDAALRQQADSTIERVLRSFTTYQITVALQDTWDLISAVNKYIVEREPWSLAKNPERKATLDSTLYHAADTVRVIAALIDPVMPDAAVRIRRMLGVPQESWSALKAGTLAPGTALGSVEALFPRIEKTLEELRSMASIPIPPSPTPQTPDGAGVSASPAIAPVATQSAGPSGSAQATSPSPSDPARISIDDFMKVELRVAKVLEAEAVPKSKKLLKLKVDTGADQRTIVAGIAEAYQPEQLIGRTIVIVANLQPAKLMGVESQGMVLAASLDGGAPTLVGFDGPMAPGARVR
jgi:methionyl-tRNA synthetase